MNWSAIFMLIWSKLGPVITELVRSWLEQLLQQASEKLLEPKGISPAHAQRELFAKALELHDAAGGRLWFWQRLPWSQHARRRRFLERYRSQSAESDLSGDGELFALARSAA